MVLAQATRRETNRHPTRARAQENQTGPAGELLDGPVQDSDGEPRTGHPIDQSIEGASPLSTEAIMIRCGLATNILLPCLMTL